MTTVILTETNRSGTYAKLSDFIKAICVDEVALIGGTSGLDRFIYASVNKFTADNYRIQIYRDVGGSHSPTARSGYTILSLAPHILDIFYSETGATPLFPLRQDTNSGFTDLPKTQTGGSLSTNVINEHFVGYLVVRTEHAAAISAWFTKFVADPKKWVRPRNTPLARHKDPLRRAMYLNDLMNHKQPFGPSRRLK